MKFSRILLINFFIFLIIIGITICCWLLLVNSEAGLAIEQEEDKKPPKIFDIQISDISSTSTVITWKTDEKSDSLINYGLDKSYGVVRDPYYDKTSHKLVIDNLEQQTTYYFRITSADTHGNQGISDDYSFVTTLDQTVKKEGAGEQFPEKDQTGKLEIEYEKKGLLDEIRNLIRKINSESDLALIESSLQNRADEIAKPPIIIGSSAKVEVGSDYAIINWQTDKPANTIVAIAEEANYRPGAENPYTWKQGEANEYVLSHRVEITNLKPATVYHFQLISTSELDLEGRTDDNTFKTKSILPEIYNIRVEKVEENAATLRWTTNVPCSAIVEYTNLDNKQPKLEGNSTFVTFHQVRLNNLDFDTTYMAVIRVENENNEKTLSDPLTFTTVKDRLPPVISKVNTESTLYPGNDNKVQTIVSWETDELAVCQFFYQQGLGNNNQNSSLQAEVDAVSKHVQVVTAFLPATVYRFWIKCLDKADNETRSEDFTMLTPVQEQSIIDLIIGNFESTFGWVKKF